MIIVFVLLIMSAIFFCAICELFRRYLWKINLNKSLKIRQERHDSLIAKFKDIGRIGFLHNGRNKAAFEWVTEMNSCPPAFPAEYEWAVYAGWNEQRNLIRVVQ